MNIDLDGNIDCTNDGDNDDYPQRVTDRCVFHVTDLGKAELDIRATCRRYNDVEGVDVVHSDETFRRVVVTYANHEVIYDLHLTA
jgi:hypothetical protein